MTSPSTSLLRAGLGLICCSFSWFAAAQPAPQVTFQATGSPPAYRVVGDAIPMPLTAQPGDAAKGRAIVSNRTVGLCLLCHAGPLPEERFQGNLAPTLEGTGSRWTEGQLRLRLVDARRLNPNSLMPSYYQTDGLNRVAPTVQGKPLLNAEQIEDVVAFLRTLQ